MTTSETKKMDSKLVIDKADITEDTSIICLYDTDHVKTQSTLDVVRKFTIQILFAVLTTECGENLNIFGTSITMFFIKSIELYPELLCVIHVLQSHQYSPQKLTPLSDVSLTGVKAAAKYTSTTVTCSVTEVISNSDPALTVTWTVGSTIEDGDWQSGSYSATKKVWEYLLY